MKKSFAFAAVLLGLFISGCYHRDHYRHPPPPPPQHGPPPHPGHPPPGV